MRTSSTKSASDPSFSRRSSETSWRPLRQVVITRITAAAMSSGTQPPCAIFDRLPERNVISSPPNATAASTIFHGRQCQSSGATRSSSNVSTTSAPVTETPYAVARRADDRNASMTASTPRNSSPFTTGR